MPYQLSLFQDPEIPNIVDALLSREDCVLAISISGGKDSQAMLSWLAQQRKYRGWCCQVFAVHADLGRIEWTQTATVVQSHAENHNIPLVVVRREKGDMINRWRQRYQTLKAQGNTKPFWSSASARYCTSDLKVAPIDKYLRRYPLSVVAIGLRAEESPNRAKKTRLSYRKTIISTKYKDLPFKEAIKQYNGKSRLSLNWLPIQDWSLDKVWNQCGTSTEEWHRRRGLPDEDAIEGWPAHPAYVLGHGNHRLSCAFCVLADVNDLTNAIAYNEEVYSELVELEKESGWTFQHNRSLLSLTNK